MRARAITIAVLAAAALVAAIGAVTPALAAERTTFAVTDNAGVLVTRQPLTAGQEFYCGGIAYTVRAVRGSIITVTPAFPAGDAGKVVTCST
jgi:hypothetical protein